MKRRDFLAAAGGSVLAGAWPWPAASAGADSRQASGVKVGEISHNSAIVWTRVTERGVRRYDGVIRRGRPEPFPKDLRSFDLEGSCPGAPGRVRVRLSAREDLQGARDTGWVDVDPQRDFSHQFEIAGLQPSTMYFYSAETAGPNGRPHEPLRGSFRTAPLPDSPEGIQFAMMTCQKYSQLDHPDGFHIYDSIEKLAPRFLVSAGDVVYYDSDDPRATSVELARYHWQRMYSYPRHIKMGLTVPGYWEKDDHDTLFDDAWSTREPNIMLPFTWDEGLRLFREQTPMGPLTYRTARWGKSLQIWLVEGRDYRSPNNMPDGPDKTIWGVEQKQWLKRTMLASDADWKLLVSPTPLVGPDRGNKNDNHSNRTFQHEGDEIRGWVQANLGDSFFNLNGDRHWQYHSIHPDSKVHEFSAGAASDAHAAGSPGEDRDYHRFHQIKGGFLSVETQRKGNLSEIVFRHRDVFGKVVYEYRRERKVT
ncbi:MAG: alkaline phosphatase D family protein [Bryobacterales bacterium]|nr:alkaline phosphatase D family protein [Bryobacterales bacterium]